MESVVAFIRGGYAPVKMGKAFEFPDALRSLQSDYDMLVDDKLSARLDAIAEKDAPKAVEECKRLATLVDSISVKVSACNDFDNQATKGEMLDRLEQRRHLLAMGIQGYGRKGNPHDDPKVLEQRTEHLTTLCSQFVAEQMKLKGDLADLLYDGKIMTRDLGDAKKLVHQLEDLNGRWWAYFGELKDTMAKRGVPNFEPAMLMPDNKLLAFYQDKAGL